MRNPIKIDENFQPKRKMAMRVKKLVKCPACNGEYYIDAEELNFPTQECRLCHKIAKVIIQ